MKRRLGAFFIGLGSVCAAVGLWLLGHSVGEVAGLIAATNAKPEPTATQDALNELFSVYRLTTQRPSVH